MSHEPTLEERVRQLEDRNRRVEKDKAWETSWTRRLSIAVVTYLTIVAYLHYVIHNGDPWVNALVPVIGFFLSTLTVSQLKRFWIGRRS